MRLLALLIFLGSSFSSFSQNHDSTAIAIRELPDKYFSKVDKKITNVNNHLSNKSLKYLKKIERQEKRLQKYLAKLDPESAKNIFADTKEKYSQFSEKIKSKTAISNKIVGGQYSSYLDTIL